MVTRQGSDSAWQRNVYSPAELEAATEGGCDRRLSRAARRLLEKQLRRHVLHVEEESSSTNNHDDEETIWTLLEDWLHDAKPVECPLFPSRDCLRHDEEQSIAVKPPTLWKGAYAAVTLKERRKTTSTRPANWWKCGYCGKAFLTRFYLDVHLQQQHHHHSHHSHAQPLATSVKDADLACPATDWCRVVGVANCHEQALLDEPYYDRGSGGWGDDDGSLILHRWTKQAHSTSCNLETIRSDCRQILEACRVSDTIMCDTLTCPRHYRFWQEDGASLIPDHWSETWRRETQHHHVGAILGILLCLALCGWVYHMTMTVLPLTAHKRHPGKRLLQKSPIAHSARTSFVRRHTLTKRGKFD